jgi:hypothetical protein
MDVVARAGGTVPASTLRVAVVRKFKRGFGAMAREVLA